MTDIPETISRIIIPNNNDKERKILIESLNSVPNDDIKRIGEEIENRQKIEENEGNETVEKSENKIEENLDQNLDEDFRVICDVDGSNVEYNSTKKIMRWRGKDYNVDTFIGVRMFLDEMMKAGIDQNGLLAISAEMEI